MKKLYFGTYGVEEPGFWQRLWCKLFHRKMWHWQRYTDRVRYFDRLECWMCECPHSKYVPVPDKDKDKYKERP